MYRSALARLLRELVSGGETAVVAVHNFLGTRIAGREHVHMPPELLLAVIDAVAPAFRCACMHASIFACLRLLLCRQTIASTLPFGIPTVPPPEHNDMPPPFRMLCSAHGHALQLCSLAGLA